jgi:nitrile hydratase
MDGIHDLGGRHGFGKIDVDEEEVQFHEPYEGRIRSIVHAMTQAPDWSIDWFRHCRELIEPTDYLTRPYFDQWAQTYGAMMVNSGWATVNELATGKAESTVEGLPAPIDAAKAKASVLKARRFDADISAQPAFQVGDSVLTTTVVTNGHTRLPGYARGRSGAVIAHHGAHVFPDAMAVNEKRHEHLYTVEFVMAQLWPEASESTDTVTLDLWESYLERI